MFTLKNPAHLQRHKHADET